MEKLNCVICKKMFYTSNWEAKNGAKFCSHECYWKSKIGHIPWNKNKKTGIIPRTAFKKGMTPWNKNIKGVMKAWNKGKNKPIRKSAQGYIQIYKPEHPFHNRFGYINRARLVMEKFLHRYLNSKEVVHHINFIRDDDRIQNLQLFEDSKDHKRFHMILRYSKNKIIAQ